MFPGYESSNILMSKHEVRRKAKASDFLEERFCQSIINNR